MNTVNFYSTKEAYGEFSNFAAFSIEIDGKAWRTTEHYFQAQKFSDESYQEKIRLEASPMIAARLGRSRKFPIRTDWEGVKDDIMRRAVTEKFKQHENLKNLLTSTGDAELVEHTKNDSYWGDGGDGTGKNMLGKILMEVRANIQKGDNNVRT
jgi:ribA/ribD-fused uncharacterized protein